MSHLDIFVFGRQMQVQAADALNKDKSSLILLLVFPKGENIIQVGKIQYMTKHTGCPRKSTFLKFLDEKSI